MHDLWSPDCAWLWVTPIWGKGISSTQTINDLHLTYQQKVPLLMHLSMHILGREFHQSPSWHRVDALHVVPLERVNSNELNIWPIWSIGMSGLLVSRLLINMHIFLHKVSIFLHFLFDSSIFATTGSNHPPSRINPPDIKWRPLVVTGHAIITTQIKDIPSNLF